MIRNLVLERVNNDRIFKEFSKEFESTVGYIIEVAVCKYLIGDINELGGVCDDCVQVKNKDIVIINWSINAFYFNEKRRIKKICG